ncbi:porin [Mangrovimonas aestuarii]|uniref:porin n=1 Tax=Mangrovimonas aestuarii TaxID=3018443 RepID=UPI002379DD9B|nr:porin [Mangrovimonas aestuarii]
MYQILKKYSLLFFLRLSVITIITVISFSNKLYSQQKQTDSIKIEFKPYSSFRGHLAYYNDEIEIQENASRIGFDLAVLKEKTRFFVRVNLGVNLFKGPVQFNVDANTNSGFLTVRDEQSRQVFTSRLGYLGIEFEKYGILSIGKQWSVYYDVSGYTDWFNVFGGQGSATYVAQSDGGDSGTGRANQAIIHRFSWWKLAFGSQLIFNNTINNNLIDGFGFSLQFKPIEGLSIGSAFIKRNLADPAEELVLGLNGDSQYWTVGASFMNDKLELGFVYANQKNGDYTETVVQSELVSAVFDAEGIEFYAKFKKPKYSILAGYNYYDPKVSDLPIDSEYNIKYFILGAEYKPIGLTTIYGEFRLSDSVDQFGISDFNVLTLGLRFELHRNINGFIKI